MSEAGLRRLCELCIDDMKKDSTVFAADGEGRQKHLKEISSSEISEIIAAKLEALAERAKAESMKAQGEVQSALEAGDGAEAKAGDFLWHKKEVAKVMSELYNEKGEIKLADFTAEHFEDTFGGTAALDDLAARGILEKYTDDDDKERYKTLAEGHDKLAALGEKIRAGEAAEKLDSKIDPEKARAMAWELYEEVKGMKTDNTNARKELKQVADGLKKYKDGLYGESVAASEVYRQLAQFLERIHTLGIKTEDDSKISEIEKIIAESGVVAKVAGQESLARSPDVKIGRKFGKGGPYRPGEHISDVSKAKITLGQHKRFVPGVGGSEKDRTPEVGGDAYLRGIIKDISSEYKKIGVEEISGLIREMRLDRLSKQLEDVSGARDMQKQITLAIADEIQHSTQKQLSNESLTLLKDIVKRSLKNVGRV